MRYSLIKHMDNLAGPRLPSHAIGNQRNRSFAFSNTFPFTATSAAFSCAPSEAFVGAPAVSDPAFNALAVNAQRASSNHSLTSSPAPADLSRRPARRRHDNLRGSETHPTRVSSPYDGDANHSAVGSPHAYGDLTAGQAVKRTDSLLPYDNGDATRSHSDITSNANTIYSNATISTNETSAGDDLPELNIDALMLKLLEVGILQKDPTSSLPSTMKQNDKRKANIEIPDLSDFNMENLKMFDIL